ncbi:hypothetical protein DLAC_01980 [Tieghemostelium lacteum]|uniref:Uncharacterized protein n=1 Tax=Tieghemostelium lacteum TaxID=361077 RepID=A0A152A5L8_TIELA|nr:hypothetical protein DLAC_01980 [Tieghemostelium lacteum]|eukprot:KYR01391.1 hypothetical protein DLAC_01980 [Tieghemostelium lacteum]
MNSISTIFIFIFLSIGIAYGQTCSISGYTADSCSGRYIYNNSTTISNKFDMGRKQVTFQQDLVFNQTTITIDHYEGDDWPIIVQNKLQWVGSNYMNIKTFATIDKSATSKTITIKTTKYTESSIALGSIIFNIEHNEPGNYGCIMDSISLLSAKAICSNGPLTKTISIFIKVKGSTPQLTDEYRLSKRNQIVSLINTPEFTVKRVGVSFQDVTSNSYTLVIDLLGSLSIYPDAKDIYGKITIDALKNNGVIGKDTNAEIGSVTNAPAKGTPLNNASQLQNGIFLFFIVFTIIFQLSF